jgi:colanic acid/amylovoran biosynthesis glycosyltransferase
MNHFAYVFERFPSFTQTFCAREVLELQRQGAKLLLFSIHDVADEEVQHFPAELRDQVHVLPQEKELVKIVNQLKDERKLPQSIVLTLRDWGDIPDKTRLYEAAYIGYKMQEAGVRHAHAHFAGLAARTCWWLRQFYQHTYSFTGHANDMFVDPGLPLTLGHLVKDAAVVITVSDYTASWLHQRFPTLIKKIHRVYNGIDLASITPHTTGHTKHNPPIIFSVGRLIEKKGFDDLIRACAHLRSAEIPFQCHIAGEGPLATDLRMFIQSFGLQKEVHLLGPLPQKDILAWLGAADVFALPCITERDGGKDNLPTVLMEAMAAALPCVSTTLAGVPEMVVHEQTGLLCEERHPKEFAHLLERILKDQNLAIAYGQAGLKRAQQLFAKETTACHLLSLLIEYGDIQPDAALQSRLPSLSVAYQKQTLPKLQRWIYRFRHRNQKQALKP